MAVKNAKRVVEINSFRKEQKLEEREAEATSMLMNMSEGEHEAAATLSLSPPAAVRCSPGPEAKAMSGHCVTSSSAVC